MEIREGYKQTEVGVIPEEWECLSIGEFTHVRAGGTPSTYRREFWGGQIKWMNSGELNNKRIYDVSGRITEEGLKNSSTSLIPSECVLIGLAGQGKTRGTVAINYVELCTNQSIAAIFPSDKINNELLYHFLDSLYKYLRELSSGDGGRGGLNLKLIKSIFVPIPPLLEQQAIATALSDIDGLINSLQKLIDKKKKIKQSAMQELLTGKRRLEGFSGEWVEVSLKDVAKFFKGKGLAKSDISNGGKYKCIHYGELFTVYKENIKSVISRTSINEGAFLSKENDVLMPTSDVTPNGLAKASCIQENNVILGGDILIIRSDDNIDGVFLSNVIRYNESQVLKLVSGITVYHLYASDMKNFYFRCPPTKAEQTAIANILSDMDSEIEALERKLNKYKDIKQGMMQELLTGRIRLLEEAVP